MRTQNHSLANKLAPVQAVILAAKENCPWHASAGIMSVIVKNKPNGRLMALPRDACDT